MPETASNVIVTTANFEDNDQDLDDDIHDLDDDDNNTDNYDQNFKVGIKYVSLKCVNT